MSNRISFIDDFLRYSVPQFNPALEEYVERGRYREEKGIGKDVSLSFKGIESYRLGILGVEGTVAVISVCFLFHCSGADDAGHYDVSAVCRWNIPLKEKGLVIGKLCCGIDRARPEWLYGASLLPSVHRREYPRMAGLFLKKVFGEDVPDLTGYPLAMEMVKRLGLKTRESRLPGRCRGRIVMRDCVLPLPSDDGSVIEEPVAKGTILYDSMKIPSGREDITASVILHECFHWVFHRAAFELGRLHSPFDTGFICSDDRSVEGTVLKESAYDLEIVNDAVVRYLLFSPEEIVRSAERRIGSWTESRMTGSGMPGKVLEEVRRMYGFSLEETRRCLIDGGMTEFRGIGCRVDGRYLWNYVFSPGFLSDDETAELPGKEMERLFSEDEKVRELVLGGEYIYVDSHLVLNSPVYIGWYNPVTPFLTSYARLHAEECFMKFRITGKREETYGSLCVTGEDISEYEPVFSSLQCAGVSDEWRAYLGRWRECRRKSAGETLSEILKMNSMSPDIFSDEERVSSAYIRRVISGMRGLGPKTIMAIAGRIRMPYELIPWFAEMFNRHFYSNRPDVKPYLDAVRNAPVSDDMSPAVRAEMERRLAKQF